MHPTYTAHNKPILPNELRETPERPEPTTIVPIVAEGQQSVLLTFALCTSFVLVVVSKATTSCSNIGSHIDFYLKYVGRGVVI